jgi:hypothetical protein
MAQRKPKKGTPGYLRQKNAMKRQTLTQAVKYIDQLEKDNEAMRFDPGTMIGKFFTQYRELSSQNSRLSVLCACLLKKSGDKVVLTKEETESFKDQRINIKWELPEGVTEAAEAASFVFTYAVQPIQQPGQPMTVVPTETPGAESPQEPEPELADTPDEAAETTGGSISRPEECDATIEAADEATREAVHIAAISDQRSEEIIAAGDDDHS